MGVNTVRIRIELSFRLKSRGDPQYATRAMELALEFSQPLRRLPQRLRFIAESLDPLNVRLAAKPRQLPLRVIAMALLGFGDGGFLAQAVEQIESREGRRGIVGNIDVRADVLA